MIYDECQIITGSVFPFLLVAESLYLFNGESQLKDASAVSGTCRISLVFDLNPEKWIPKHRVSTFPRRRLVVCLILSGVKHGFDL